MSARGSDRFADSVRVAWPDQADQVLAILRDGAWRDDPAVVAWRAQCYHDPSTTAGGRVSCKLKAIDRVLGGFGVEVIRGRAHDRYYGDIQAEYINFGDTYDQTIVYDCERGTWRVTSWGDWVEEHGEDREVA